MLQVASRAGHAAARTLVTCLLAAVLSVSTAGAATLVIPVAEDEMVSSGSPSTNYQDTQGLYVGVSSSGALVRSYLKFPLANLRVGATVTRAVLKVYQFSRGYSAARPIGAYKCADTWAETGVTWSNAPAPSGSPLATVNPPLTAGQWFEWDITAAIMPERLGDGTLSLVLKELTESGEPTVGGWMEREADPRFAYLEITFTEGYSVSGHTTMGDGTAIRDVQVLLPEPGLYRFTDTLGAYQFTGLGSPTTFTVVPNKANWTFAPSTASITYDGTGPSRDDVDFVGAYTGSPDTTAPSIAFTYPASGATVFNLLGRVTGTASDAQSGVQSVEVALLDNTVGQWWMWDGQIWWGTYSDAVFTPATGASSWELTSGLPASLTPGHQYYVVARARDYAGNRHADWSWPNRSFTCAADTTGPTCTITYPASSSYQSVTRLAGTAADADSGVAKVEVYLAYYAGTWYYWSWTTQTWVTSFADPTIWKQATGTTSWEVTDGLPIWTKGQQYRVRARGVDNSGNVTATTPYVDFTIATSDVVPPSVGITYPVNGGTYSGIDHLTGTADDGTGAGVSRVEVLVLDLSAGRYWYWPLQTWMSGYDEALTWSAATGTTSWQRTAGLPPTWSKSHIYRICARGFDGVGNLSSPVAAADFTVSSADSTAPTAVITAPANGATVQWVPQITGTATDSESGVAVVRVYIWNRVANLYWLWDDRAWGAYDANKAWKDATGTTSWQVTDGLPFPWPGGQYRIRALSLDRVGNSPATPPMSDFTVSTSDTTAPTCAISYPANGVSYSVVDHINGTASDAGSGVAYVEAYLRSVTSGTYFYWATNTWGAWDETKVWARATGTTSWSISSGLPDGLLNGYTFQVGARALDGAANASTTATSQFTISTSDATAPTAAFSYPASAGQLLGLLDHLAGTAR
jgi:hypothetical protein